MAHLLVTGGASYLGSQPLRAPHEADHSAVVYDDLSSGHASQIGDVPLVEGNILDPDALAQAFERHGPFEGVLHFAALLSVPESVADPLRYYRNNVTGSATLLEAALAHGARAFVLSSTAAVYGHPEVQPIAETAPCQPVNPYGASKWMVERMLADLEHARGLRWAALRYFNACGADPAGGLGECHEPETHLIPLALEAAAGLRPALSLFGSDYPTPDGTCVRDYVHVTDLASAHVLALERLLAGETCGARNLGTGRGQSNREILASIERVTGHPVPIEECARRPGDPPELVADATRFMRETGWTPQHSDLDTILSTAWTWLQHHLL
ncbi:MAG: UDP-glucose 4-epimerase GalE [Myxococcota bacterium]